MKLDRLKQLYTSLKQNEEDYYIFKFVKNKVEFEILYDIHPSPHRLHFLVKGSTYHLILDVLNGFYINQSLSEVDYYALIKILNLPKSNKDKFKTTDFFNEFN